MGSGALDMCDHIHDSRGNKLESSLWYAAQIECGCGSMYVLKVDHLKGLGRIRNPGITKRRCREVRNQGGYDCRKSERAEVFAKLDRASPVQVNLGRLAKEHTNYSEGNQIQEICDEFGVVSRI